MYLWESGVERQRMEQEAKWVMGYTTTRDALIAIEEMKAGKKAQMPSYVKPHIAPPAELKPENLDAQLQGLALMFPDNIDLGTSNGVTHGESRRA